MTTLSQLEARLDDLADAAYAAFTLKLAPGLAPAAVRGIRMPRLRALARELRGRPLRETFLASELPHPTYEEQNLHGLLLAQERSPQALLEALDRFVPTIDNWATCDVTACGAKLLRRHPGRVLPKAEEWLAADGVYTRRFGIVTLLAHYLDEHFDPAHLALVATVPREEYYVRMAAAWYYSVALVKHYETTLPLLRRASLDPWTHNKTIQKACESFRIPDGRKAELRKLKR